MQNQYKMNRILTLGVLFSLLFGTYRTACASQSLPTYDLGETVVTAYVDGSHHPGRNERKRGL